MNARLFKWFPYSGKRHAVPVESGEAEETKTLCGVDVPASRDKLPGLARCWSTCTDCDTEWRNREGISQFPPLRIKINQGRRGELGQK
ncbi:MULTISPECIES: zinc finger protein [Actinosynnema]|uniref:zinc finger protein n=1 Tax=Actinosynnema TaxID=40566 RepID=UPI0020A418FB|nr:zinc finger protein [Actinosynnema pretiosum]